VNKITELRKPEALGANYRGQVYAQRFRLSLAIEGIDENWFTPTYCMGV
jgi:hypothetical protein